MPYASRHAPPVPGHFRSAGWPAAERAHLHREPRCRACGGVTDLNVHHVRPFHLYPELELDPENLVTLCRYCHLVFGHFHDWSSFNPEAIADADHYRRRVESRPAG